ncbi:6504_t:CDS:2 [Funneliformis mosseae]|uniref:6504_t:CDS:1 n=1 Tax=Funneliformis mosseae TaxID=27381 RepID=A0A9N8ZRG2_FUNMO|nr:6504_t:CDS:2 [Funneliformis mosseae]
MSISNCKRDRGIVSPAPFIEAPSLSCNEDNYIENLRNVKANIVTLLSNVKG